MTGKERDDLDATILRAILGSEKEVQDLPMRIEDNYFEREMRENLKEQGYPVDMPEETWTDKERIIRRSYKLMEELEGERVNRKMEPYAGFEEEDVMEKKEMGFMDQRFMGQVFETLVSFKQVKAKATGRWFTIIKVGKEQDITVMITARADGQGTTVLTDKEEWMVDKRTITRETVKI